MLWPKLVADDGLARALLTHAADSFYLATPFYASIGEEAIADLYLLMERLFPPHKIQGSVRFRKSLSHVPPLRDGAPRYLAIGHRKAVRALRRLARSDPTRHFFPSS